MSLIISLITLKSVLEDMYKIIIAINNKIKQLEAEKIYESTRIKDYNAKEQISQEA